MLFGFAAAKLANYLDITKIYINVFDFIRQFLFILQTEPPTFNTHIASSTDPF